MSQPKLESFIESLVNILIGFLIAIFSQILLFPLVGIQGTKMSTHLELGLYFTLISLIRSYCVRLWFNKNIGLFSHYLATLIQKLKR